MFFLVFIILFSFIVLSVFVSFALDFTSVFNLTLSCFCLAVWLYSIVAQNQQNIWSIFRALIPVAIINHENLWIAAVFY